MANNDRFTKEDSYAFANRMTDYGTGINNGGVAIFNVVQSTGWNDSQSATFQNACGILIGDMINAIHMVDAYSEHLRQKLQRL